MKILLISPHPKKTRSFANLGFPPLNLQQITSITPNEHNIDIIDESFRTNKKLNFEKYDLVGITCVTYTSTRAYQLADTLRSKGIPVILGGWHPTALPDEAKEHADSVVIGEAENNWRKLLKDFEKGELKPFYYQEKPLKSDLINNASHDILKKFYIYEGIESTRGCPMGCTFCAITNSKYGNIFRTKSIDNVIEEIKSIKKKYICFYDPSMTNNPAYTIELFEKIKDLNKKFICHGNIDVLLRREDILKSASNAGCIIWSLGFDSVSQKSVDSTGIKSNRVSTYKKLIEKVHDYGMSIDGTFMFGFDTDEKNIFKDTKDIVSKLEIDSPIFNTLTPFPGTPIYDKFNREGRLLTKEWEKYDLLNVVFKPKNMTEEELLNGTIDTRRYFYSNIKRFKRNFKTVSLGYHPFKMASLQNINFLIGGITSFIK